MLQSRDKYLILPLTQRVGCAIMMERILMTRLKDVGIMSYAIYLFLRESQF